MVTPLQPASLVLLCVLVPVLCLSGAARLLGHTFFWATRSFGPHVLFDRTSFLAAHSLPHPLPSPRPQVPTRIASVLRGCWPPLFLTR